MVQLEHSLLRDLEFMDRLVILILILDLSVEINLSVLLNWEPRFCLVLNSISTHIHKRKHSVQN
jgi:hypothetical protein